MAFWKPFFQRTGKHLTKYFWPPFQLRQDSELYKMKNKKREKGKAIFREGSKVVSAPSYLFAQTPFTSLAPCPA